jgi:hypothetical protein
MKPFNELSLISRVVKIALQNESTGEMFVSIVDKRTLNKLVVVL